MTNKGHASICQGGHQDMHGIEPRFACYLQAAPARRSSTVVRADGFLGSPNNLVSTGRWNATLYLRLTPSSRQPHGVTCSMQIVLASTTLFLAAGRFGLTPSANRLSTPGLKLVENKSGLQTGDPAGQ